MKLTGQVLLHLGDSGDHTVVPQVEFDSLGDIPAASRCHEASVAWKSLDLLTIEGVDHDSY
jgi:hypothetical protein